MEPEGLLGLAAAPVGGGRAWPGFEMTRRSPAVWRAPYGLLAPAAAPMGGGKAWPNTPAEHEAPAAWRAPVEPHGLLALAAAPMGGGRAWPGFEIDHSDPLLFGGHQWNRRDCWPRLQRPWVAAGPGRASRSITPSL